MALRRTRRRRSPSSTVPGTPCIVVNGRYRIADSVRAPAQVIALVRYLVENDYNIKNKNT